MVSTYWFEHALEALVRNSILQRHIHSVTFPLSTSSVFLRSRSGEILPELMEATRHNAVGGVECFFNSISVVTVDVDVEHAGICAEEFEYSEYDVVYVAKARCLPLLRVVEPAGPVDCNVRRPGGDPLRCACKRV